MATRKKATKKSSRPSKVIKRSTKSSSAGRGKDAKTSARVAKPARPAKRKIAKGAKVSTRAVAPSKKKTLAAKTLAAKTVRAKTSRAATPARSPAKGKVVLTSKKKSPALAPDIAARSAASQPIQQKIVSAAKSKPESVKKGHERLSATVDSKTAQSKAPAMSDGEPKLREPSRVAAPSPIVVPEAAVSPRPAKPAVSEKPAAQIAEEATGHKVAKSGPHRHGFKTSEYIVYPSHGVGQIVAIEEQEVAGFRLELFVITFVKDKMTLRVPTGKVAGVGMRKLAEPDVVNRALDILLGRARIKRTMWSRRAQEYETKINSGDLTAISEVVRDLYRSEAQPEQSYSERQLYEAALDRLAREVAVVQKLSESEALKAIDGQLQRGQRRGAKAAGEATPVGVGDADVEEAA